MKKKYNVNISNLVKDSTFVSKKIVIYLLIVFTNIILNQILWLLLIILYML